MDIILLFLAKPLDRYGITLVRIIYPPLSAKLMLLSAVKILCFSSPNWSPIPDIPRNYRRLINNRTTVFCLMLIFVSVLNKAYRTLDVDTKIVKIR